jgi:acyl dehydratase
LRVTVGDSVPEWSLPEVTPERMRTVAAILRDPNPVHWDRAFTATVGLDGKLVNQSPVNLGYIANMLIAWAGPECIRRLRVTFPLPVLDGDTVVAGGTVVKLWEDDGDRLAECAVWLDRGDGQRAVDGIAVVGLPR